MKELAIGVCGKGKKSFTKKRDKWWDDEVQDAVESRRHGRIAKPQVRLKK